MEHAEPVEQAGHLEHAEARERMREIQRIMERATLYTLLPGLPAVIGGVLALVGCAVTYAMIRSFDYAALLGLSLQAQLGFCVMWTIIGIAAITQDIALTTRAARKQGLHPVGRPGRFAALSLTPSVFVAIIVTLRLLSDAGAEQIQYIAPVWMMCYGTGVYAAGLFSVRLPRLLGLAFIAAGAAGMLFLESYGVLLTALSFGLFHIVFGVMVIRVNRGRTS